MRLKADPKGLREGGRRPPVSAFATAKGDCRVEARVQRAKTGGQRTDGVGLSRALVAAVLCGYAAWVVFPMVWVAYSSLKSDRAIFADTFALPSPGRLRFDNYGHAWREAHFRDYFLHSVL